MHSIILNKMSIIFVIIWDLRKYNKSYWQCIQKSHALHVLNENIGSRLSYSWYIYIWGVTLSQMDGKNMANLLWRKNNAHVDRYTNKNAGFIRVICHTINHKGGNGTGTCCKRKHVCANRRLKGSFEETGALRNAQRKFLMVQSPLEAEALALAIPGFTAHFHSPNANRNDGHIIYSDCKC